MNIVVKTYGGSICCRPDTTWERENRDFYSPDCVDTLHWTPVVLARICKAGKCIGEKFASRYYDAMNFGAMLYIGEFMNDLASASCADHTSILPFPLYNTAVFENPDNHFRFTKNGNGIFECSTEGLASRIEEAICEASVLTSLRIGDFAAVELAAPSLLVSREEKQCAVAATFCDNGIFDFKLIF